MIKDSLVNRVVLAVATTLLIGLAVYYGIASVYEKPSVADVKTSAVLKVTYIKSIPLVDGKADNPVWKDIPVTTIKITGAPVLSMQAVYTDEKIYIRSYYEGKQTDALHHIWEYDGENWHEQPPGDMVAYLFNMNDSLEEFNSNGWNIFTFKDPTTEEEWPFEYCKDCHGFHGTPLRRKPKKSPWPFLKIEKPTDESLKQRGDLWELSLGISCPTGKGLDWYLCPVPNLKKLPENWSTEFIFQFMPDKFVYQRPYTVDTSRRTDETGKIVDDIPIYKYKDGKNLDNVPFPYFSDMEPITDYSVFMKGDRLPHVIYEEGAIWGGSGDDLDSRAQWKSGVWTVDVGRKLNTGHPEDDVIFTPKKVTKTKYYFGVWLRTRTIVDSGKAAALSRPMILEFQPKE